MMEPGREGGGGGGAGVWWDVYDGCLACAAQRVPTRLLHAPRRPIYIPAGVVGGAVAGHGAATSIAVLGGSFLGKYLDEKVVQYVGGSLFLVSGPRAFIIVCSSAAARVCTPCAPVGGKPLLLRRLVRAAACASPLSAATLPRARAPWLLAMPSAVLPASEAALEQSNDFSWWG